MMIVHVPITDDWAAKCDQCKQMVTKTAMEILGQKKRIHKDWLEEHNEDIGELQDSWWNQTVMAVQHYVNLNKS